jgi:hypothetical protein
MICSEVQRTLVKSPPELWAEISDPASLARHLGEFGEIRITRVDPEQRVEWEAGDTSGSVVIKPSGWGTKVKLTVTREPAEADRDGLQALAAVGPAQPEAERPGEETPSAEGPIGPGRADEAALEGGGDPSFADDEPARGEDTPALPAAEPVPAGEAAEQAAVAETAPEPQTEDGTAIEPRRGFFARLLGRRRRAPALEPLATAEGALQSTPQVAREPTAGAPYNALAVWASQMDPTDGADEEPADALDAAPAAIPAEACEDTAGDGERADLAADAEASEQDAAEQVTAVLTGVLDRLGAAHHRPFSRG